MHQKGSKKLRRISVVVERRPLMREVESSNPDDGYTHFRAGAYSTCELLIDHKLRPVVNRQVGSHPTVMLDIGMPYPPWNRIQLVVH